MASLESKIIVTDDDGEQWEIGVDGRDPEAITFKHPYRESPIPMSPIVARLLALALAKAAHGLGDDDDHD